MSIKNMIDQKVFAPSMGFMRDEEDVIGVVVKSNSDAMTCSVEYDSGEGLVVLDNCTTKLGFNIFSGGFPDVGDGIVMDIRNGAGVITGHDHSYGKEKKKKDTELKNDQYSDMVATDTQGGFIY